MSEDKGTNVNEQGQPTPEGNKKWVGFGISIGLLIGMLFGLAMKNMAFGVPIGIALGAAFGMALQKKKEKEMPQ
ncbi:hypothetical protein [Saccharibacillus alkalitolerans]|uniref:Glycine zipper-like domain-containing protein n=1 Tax=Saccharibacillus alkalitolerans TaxID=2705290 RepID=A0ABX0F0I4_9BACL|nr:hypothetical protein [Saccharibacillus alkalitolerans]NGZ74045.1 hypothetical protein [Saccharibacillus alkalitolerans]